MLNSLVTSQLCVVGCRKGRLIDSFACGACGLCLARYTSLLSVLLCLYRIGASFVLTTLLYVSDTHKRILLWLQLASIVWILVCGVLTTGRFFAALVSGDTALSICPSPGGRPHAGRDALRHPALLLSCCSSSRPWSSLLFR